MNIYHDGNGVEDGERTPLTSHTNLPNIKSLPNDNGKISSINHHRRHQHNYLNGSGNNNNNNNIGGHNNHETRRRRSSSSSFKQDNFLYIQQNPKHPWKDGANWALAMVASALALSLGIVALVGNMRSDWKNGYGSDSSSSSNIPLFDELGRYVIEDYDSKPAFSDFLPGLAGVYGKPLYAFIVNRGQGIASFGVTSKDYPILEYNPVNKAYQNTPAVGFRTFIQGERGNTKFLVEPFSPLRTKYPNVQDLHIQQQQRKYPKRTMYAGENELQIQESDIQNHLDVNVSYFILPEEDFGAFVRRTTIRNTHRRKPVTISMLDGLARMEPAGGKLDMFLKNMGRTLEGWMGVYFPYDDSIAMPYYRLTTEPADKASVKVQERGHYCISMLEGRGDSDNPTRLLPIVYDTSKVFGDDTTLLQPVSLYEKEISEIVNGPQYGVAKTSSCFAALDKVVLEPGEQITVSSFYGAADHILDVPVYARRALAEGFVLYKLTRTREVIRQITASVETKTSNDLFDAHVQQMYLDNVLQGGIPLILGDEPDNDQISTADEDSRLKVYHLFSRVQGDLERDYNDFELSHTFFSEGPGTFRDVAQNRRNDVIFNPRIGAFNIKTFLSYLQSDGYQPLQVEAVVFTIKDKNVCDAIAEIAVGRADGHRAQREALSAILHNGPFRPGQLFALLEELHIELTIVSRQDFIDLVASEAESTPMAVYDTGYWSDHWTYYMDIIRTFLCIFPDREENIMFDNTLPYFFSPAFVRPRKQKYVLTPTIDGRYLHVQQLEATVHDDPEKRQYMKNFVSKDTGWYTLDAHWQHDRNGVKFESSPYAKLLMLGTLKFATRDAYGMGIEYEAGRPGWDDANNGIPGMLGSGMPETFELKTLLKYLLDVAKKYQRTVVLPTEVLELILAIDESLDALDETNVEPMIDGKVPASCFAYWNNVAEAREIYREKTKTTFSGETTNLSALDIKSILKRWIKQIDIGIERAMVVGTQGDGDDGERGITPTYFAYNVTRWNKTGNRNSDGYPLVEPLNMTVRLFPLFLEGPTRMMKNVDANTAQSIYQHVRNSPLYDEELSMYTISASLRGQPVGMGRSIAFAPGWLENESVWLHMSYKFYLELIRHGLHDIFYEELRSGGMLPFMNRSTYGRSLLECSSFIVSSAFVDPSLRGRGFQPRLTGATAEFLTIWANMFLGTKPFFLDETSGELQMHLIPSLPLWIFETKSSDDTGREIPWVSFKLFSSINVHYYNEKRVDLFGVVPTRYKIGFRDGSVFDVNGSVIPFELADKIRRIVFVDSIEAYFS